MVSYKNSRRFDTRVRKISNNCLGIVIPSPLRRDWGITEGTEVTVLIKVEEEKRFEY